MALAAAILRCSTKLSLRSNCTPRYFILVFHSTSCSPRTILRYWKDLLSVTSKASVFSGAIFRPLLSNQRFDCRRILLILSSRIPTSSVAHTTSAQIVIYHSQQVVWNLLPHHRTIASMQMFHLAVLNALRMSMPTNAQNPLRLPVPFLAFMAMLTTAWIASIVDLPFLNPNWLSERPFSPTKRARGRCRINSFRSFPIDHWVVTYYF